MHIIHKTNILLVDDQPQNLLALEAALDLPHSRLVKAQSGYEALRCLLKEDFALVLLDVRMPELDGFETARLIRSRPKTKDLPIIFVTAESQNAEDVIHGYSLNAVDYVFKPFVREILQTKVSVFVDLYRKTEQVRQQARLLQKSEKHLEALVAERTVKLAAANQQLRQEVEERKRAEAVLQQKTEQLEQANKDLESFSYSVSHDLRAPLRGISGFSQIIARRHRESLNEEGQHYVDNVVEATKQMERLIDDLLSYAKMGRQSMSVQSLSVYEVFQKIAQQLHPRIEEAGGHLEFNPNMPIVVCNPTLLHQIFLNLVDNAITYAKPDVPPQVKVESTIEPHHVTISVSDNGIGIAPEFQEKIFNIFQRLHSDESYTGTGIGLATVKKAAELLGGSVSVESTVGEGSRFHITLPTPS
ncbi:MAG: ATP-binding protein [Chloroflexota bacterium]